MSVKYSLSSSSPWPAIVWELDTMVTPQKMRAYRTKTPMLASNNGLTIQRCDQRMDEVRQNIHTFEAIFL